MTDKKNKCAHQLCTCLAADDSKYCSPNCEAAKALTDIECGCGHPGCKGGVGTA